MIQARNRVLTIVLLLALAGCDMLTKPAPGPSGAPASAVPVQEGTISDAMIDLDKSEAQAPLRGGMPTGENLAAEKAARAILGADKKDETAPDAGEAAPDAVPVVAPKPEASKAPAPTPSGFAPKPAPRASAKPAAKPAAAPSPAPKPVRTRGPTFPKPGEE